MSEQERESERKREKGTVGYWNRKGNGVVGPQRDGAEARAHVLGVAVGCLQLFAAITFK